MLIGLTVAAVTIAVVASAVAWRAGREERRRSEARVAKLANHIYGSPPHEVELDLHPTRMFAAEPIRSGSRLGLALAIAGFAAASAGAAVIVFSGDSAPIGSPNDSDVSVRPAAHAEIDAESLGGAAPLELLELVHEREGDRLIIRGVVRNPSTGSAVDHLTAVVVLFDRDGGRLASSRAAIDSPALIPGGESPFVVTVPAAGEVARYRISFRSGDRVVAHTDKRTGS